MEIDSEKITMQMGWDGGDFMHFRHSIICQYKNLRVKFKVSDNDIKYTDGSLMSRLIIFKALKRFKKALAIYPLGGNMIYSLE